MGLEDNLFPLNSRGLQHLTSSKLLNKDDKQPSSWGRVNQTDKRPKEMAHSGNIHGKIAPSYLLEERLLVMKFFTSGFGRQEQVGKKLLEIITVLPFYKISFSSNS